MADADALDLASTALTDAVAQAQAALSAIREERRQLTLERQQLRADREQLTADRAALETDKEEFDCEVCALCLCVCARSQAIRCGKQGCEACRDVEMCFL